MTLSKIKTIYPPPQQTSKSLPQICVKHSPSATIRPVCVKFMNNFFRLYFLFSFLIHFLVWGLDLCSSSSAIRPATTCSVVKSLGKVPTGLQIERGRSTQRDPCSAPVLLAFVFSHFNLLYFYIERVGSIQRNPDSAFVIFTFFNLAVSSFVA